MTSTSPCFMGTLAVAQSRSFHQRHFLPIGQCLRLGSFPYYPDLLGVWPYKFCHHNRDDRLLNVLRQCLLDISRQLSRGFSACRQILYQGSGNFAIRSNGHRHGNFGIAPDDDIDIIPRTDQVIMGFSSGFRNGYVLQPPRERRGSTTARQENHVTVRIQRAFTEFPFLLIRKCLSRIRIIDP